MTLLDNVLNDKMGNLEQKQKSITFCRQASEAYFETNTKSWGANGGGDNCLELYRHTGETYKKQKRRRGVV